MTQAYTPSAWGELFHNLPYEEALGAGSAGPGKTTVLLADPLPQIFVEFQRCNDKKHPYHQDWGASTGWALHLRRTLKQLEQSIIRTHQMFPKIDPGARWDPQKTTWIFSSGYRYQFGHCKDRDSWDEYTSFEYTHIAFDELCSFEEEQYFQISSRKRSTDPVLSKMLKVRAMSNPVMKKDGGENIHVRDPFWVRKYFVDPAPRGKVILERDVEMPDGTTEISRRMYLPATIDDNPNKMFVKQYKMHLAGMPRHIREALLYGNWYFTEGAYYGEAWDDRIHTCAPFQVPRDWPIFRSMDWGFKLPGCVHWWAFDEDDNMFCIRELTFKDKLAGEVAVLVRQIEEKMGYWQGNKSLLSGPADYQLWEQRGEHGKSKAQEFQERGVRWVPADKKSRYRNSERLLGRLRDHRERTTTPGLVFFRGCSEAIRTLPMIQSDNNVQPPEPLKGDDDHWHDSICYACAYASHGRRGISKPRERDEWDDEDRRAPGRGERGQFGYGL
jgi:hypothetical protein